MITTIEYQKYLSEQVKARARAYYNLLIEELPIYEQPLSARCHMEHIRIHELQREKQFEICRRQTLEARRTHPKSRISCSDAFLNEISKLAQNGFEEAIDTKTETLNTALHLFVTGRTLRRRRRKGCPNLRKALSLL